MDIDEITDRIRAFLGDHFMVDFGSGVDADTDLFAQGLVDSFGFIELVSFLEREFGCEFSDAEVMLAGVNTLNGLAGLVRRKLGEQGGAAG